MSNKTLADIIQDTKNLVQEKTASFRNKQAMVGGDGSNMPGAENDKPVPASAGSPSPEVKDEGPAAARTNAGAKESEQLEAGHATKAEEGAESVKKKPLDSADANAKCASDGTADLANSLLTRIRAAQEKQAESCANATKAGEGKVAVKKDEPEEKETPAPNKKIENKQADAADAGKVELDLTTDVLAKIASVILATEEGIDFAESQLTKAAGAQAATEVMDFLHKQAAYEQGSQDAVMLIEALYEQKQAEELEKQAGAADAEALIMAAIAEQRKQGGYSVSDLQKAGQAIADEILAAQGEGGGDLGTGEEAGDVAEDIAEGGSEGDISPQELEQAIAMLVESGQIDEATAQAILAAMGGAGGEEAPVDEAAAAAEAEAAGGVPAEGMDVEASAKDLESKILGAVNQIRGKKSK